MLFFLPSGEFRRTDAILRLMMDEMLFGRDGMGEGVMVGAVRFGAAASGCCGSTDEDLGGLVGS